MIKQAIIRIPASTSNLGPGFDCLGVAVRLYNTVKVSREGDWRPPAIVAKTARTFFERTRSQSFPFFCAIQENIPRGRGLGSSATVRLGVLHGLNELSGRLLDQLTVFQLCAELEGHPDNAAPASFGGFTATRTDVATAGKIASFGLQTFKVSSRLYFVFLIPDLEIATDAARRVLPAEIRRSAAVQNTQRACAITAAFASGNYENLRGAFADQLHQPFREHLIPFLPRVISAAETAGALGAFLSGSGSAICAITLRDEKKVASAMRRAARTKARTLITTADNAGVRTKRLPGRKS